MAINFKDFGNKVIGTITNSIGGAEGGGGKGPGLDLTPNPPVYNPKTGQVANGEQIGKGVDFLGNLTKSLGIGKGKDKSPTPAPQATTPKKETPRTTAPTYQPQTGPVSVKSRPGATPAPHLTSTLNEVTNTISDFTIKTAQQSMNTMKAVLTYVKNNKWTWAAIPVAVSGIGYLCYRLIKSFLPKSRKR